MSLGGQQHTIGVLPLGRFTKVYLGPRNGLDKFGKISTQQEFVPESSSS
jgi:hypothetical protein